MEGDNQRSVSAQAARMVKRELEEKNACLARRNMEMIFRGDDVADRSVR